MWIAKPLTALTPSEKAAWNRVQAESLARGEEFPLAQTLTWGEGIRALGVDAYLAMSLDEGVGGLVYRVSQSGFASEFASEFECVNGPILAWDGGDRIARQISTFAMAVAKLDREFSSLVLQPRWLAGQLERRLGMLPFEPDEVVRASTIHVPVEPGANQRSRASVRLRRSLRAAETGGAQSSWLVADRSRVREFGGRMREFGKEKGFYVPEEKWFEALVSHDLRFFLATGSHEHVRSELLICVAGETAHYLFGYDERAVGARASISTAAVAHFRALAECAALGSKTYDLNGFTDPSERDHPYSGVSQFKAQFGGSVVDYACPIFRIEA